MSEAIPGLELMTALQNQTNQGLQAMQFGIQARQNERQLGQADRRLDMAQAEWDANAPTRNLANKRAEMDTTFLAKNSQQIMKGKEFELLSALDEQQQTLGYNLLKYVKDDKSLMEAKAKGNEWGIDLDKLSMGRLSGGYNSKAIQSTLESITQTQELTNQLRLAEVKKQNDLAVAQAGLNAENAKMARTPLSTSVNEQYRTPDGVVVGLNKENRLAAWQPDGSVRLANEAERKGFEGFQSQRAGGNSAAGTQNLGSTAFTLGGDSYQVLSQGGTDFVLTNSGRIPLADYKALNPSTTIVSNKVISSNEQGKLNNAITKGAEVISMIDSTLGMADAGVALSPKQLTNSVATLLGGVAETVGETPLVGKGVKDVATMFGFMGDTSDVMSNLDKDLGDLSGAPQVLLANTIIAVADSMGGGNRVITKDNIKNARASLGLPPEGSMKELFQNTAAVTQKLSAARTLQKGRLQNNIAARIGKTYNQLNAAEQIEVNDMVSVMTGSPISGGTQTTPPSNTVDMNKYPQQGLTLPPVVANLIGVPTLTKDQFMQLSPENQAIITNTPSIAKQFQAK
jgi:hypothetical protein